jgi:hypothetical protein
VSNPKQKPLQSLHMPPANQFGLELHSMVSPGSLQHLSAPVCEEQRENTISKPHRNHGGLSFLRAPTRDPQIPLPPSIGCLTKWRGHNFLCVSWRDSDPFLTMRSSTCSFSCAPQPGLCIEIPKGDARKALSWPSAALGGGSRT